MEISFHTHLDSNIVIATEFCTWHDSCAVVACAKMCCNLMASNGITAKRSFHRIWIAGKIVSETGGLTVSLDSPNDGLCKTTPNDHWKAVRLRQSRLVFRPTNHKMLMAANKRPTAYWQPYFLQARTLRLPCHGVKCQLPISMWHLVLWLIFKWVSVVWRKDGVAV